MRQITRILTLILSSLVLNACVGVGPRAMKTALTSYDEAVAQTQSQQLLLNLVRLRYRDVPVFLQINSISAQYEFKASAGMSAGYNTGSRDSSLGASGGIGFSERPTLSLTPLQGEAFVRRMLSPIPAQSVAVLFHSGWRIDRILRSLAQGINLIPNAPNASSPTPDIEPEYRKFKRLTTLLRKLQKQHLIDLGINRDADQQQFFMLVAPAARESEEMREIASLLNLKPGQGSYRVATSIYPQPGETVTINMRSYSGILYYFSHAIEVPEEHIRDGLVTITKATDGENFDWNEVSDGMLRVHSSSSRPERASVAVFYRDHYFYIDDADLNSKSTFSMLYEVAGLMAGDVENAGPVLTLPLQ